VLQLDHSLLPKYGIMFNTWPKMYIKYAQTCMLFCLDHSAACKVYEKSGHIEDYANSGNPLVRSLKLSDDVRKFGQTVNCFAVLQLRRHDTSRLELFAVRSLDPSLFSNVIFSTGTCNFVSPRCRTLSFQQGGK
jgi:hypothetical protein